MSGVALFVYDAEMSRHSLRHDHPMQPRRLQMTYELLDAYNAFAAPGSLAQPRMATRAELLSFHTAEYVDAVQRFSRGESLDEMGRFNFSQLGDNPVYPGVYEASALSAGGSMTAAQAISDGDVRTAFNIAGGLHHAAANATSGFCVFNDPVIAINHFLALDMRVAYVDIDAHHGDGVQNAFYDTDQVLTISTHESGQFLFPGTGFVDEIGAGAGRGFAANLPMFPYTGDDAYIWAIDEVVIPLVEAFAPDVLVTQLGVDTHANDPITHLRLTSKAFQHAVSAFAALGLPWLALGGGGYSLEAVARCWSIAYGVMRGESWPDDAPPEYAARYGIERLTDGPADGAGKELERQISDYLRQAADGLRSTLFPMRGIS